MAEEVSTDACCVTERNQLGILICHHKVESQADNQELAEYSNYSQLEIV